MEVTMQAIKDFFSSLMLGELCNFRKKRHHSHLVFAAYTHCVVIQTAKSAASLANFAKRFVRHWPLRSNLNNAPMEAAALRVMTSISLNVFFVVFVKNPAPWIQLLKRMSWNITEKNVAICILRKTCCWRLGINTKLRLRRLVPRMRCIASRNQMSGITCQ
jgi:hypothetical protein